MLKRQLQQTQEQEQEQIKEQVEETLEMPTVPNHFSLNEQLRFRDMLDRKLYLHEEINSETVDNIVYFILQFNAEDKEFEVDKRLPIILYLSSVGGDVHEAFKLIDVITTSKTPVHIVNLGYQYSAGFLIGLSGHYRYGMPHSTYLQHEGEFGVMSSRSKTKDIMKFYNRIDERIKKFVISRSCITEEQYDNNQRNEWYMTIEEAKELGVVNAIIGVDCDIDEVV